MNHRDLWKYSIIPLLLLLLMYAVLITAGVLAVGNLNDMIREWCQESLPSWLQWLYNVGASLLYISVGLLAILIIMITASAAYETTSGPFLDAMLEKYMCTYMWCQPVKKTFAFDLQFAFSMFIYGLQTMLLSLLATLLTLFFPYITLILSVIFLGSRFGTAYLAIAGYNRGMPLAETKRWAKQHSHVVRGYGTLIFLLFLFVPFLAPVVLPGIILGGSLLLHHYKNEYNEFQQH